MADNNPKRFAWGQFIFPGAVLIGQILGELILKPLYHRNVQSGMEPLFVVGYIIADLFFIFMAYYLISIMVSEF